MDNLLVYFTISVHLKFGLMRVVAFDGGGFICGGILYISLICFFWLYVITFFFFFKEQFFLI